MKRDLELIRKLLLAAEAHEHGFLTDALRGDGWSEEQVRFHIYLLGQAGFMNVVENTTIGYKSPSALPLNLTWTGYEFLEAAKDDTVWAKAKEKVLKPAGGVALDVLVAWLKNEAMSRLGLPL